MKTKRTNRGFLIAEFKDLYGESCSIQESSLADKHAIWLGCDTGKHQHVTGDCMARMHLDKKLARKLVSMLQKFIKTGHL